MKPLVEIAALIALGASLATAPGARAQAPSPAVAATPAASAAPANAELEREIAAQLAGIVPSQMRIDGVTLGCMAPADATLKTVAPGISSLTSRSFMVELQSGPRVMFCSAALSASRQLMTAARDLATDAPVTAADFSANWVDAFSAAPGALTNFPDQGPYVAATAIRAGQPLYENSLKRPLAVHPGDLVTVLVKNGAITVRAQLQAQSQAAVGDNATMINPASGLPVAVIVTGPKTAELVMQ